MTSRTPPMAYKQPKLMTKYEIARYALHLEAERIELIQTLSSLLRGPIHHCVEHEEHWLEIRKARTLLERLQSSKPTKED